MEPAVSEVIILNDSSFISLPFQIFYLLNFALNILDSLIFKFIKINFLGSFCNLFDTSGRPASLSLRIILNNIDSSLVYLYKYALQYKINPS